MHTRWASQTGPAHAMHADFIDNTKAERRKEKKVEKDAWVRATCTRIFQELQELEQQSNKHRLTCKHCKKTWDLNKTETFEYHEHDCQWKRQPKSKPPSVATPKFLLPCFYCLRCILVYGTGKARRVRQQTEIEEKVQEGTMAAWETRVKKGRKGRKPRPKKGQQRQRRATPRIQHQQIPHMVQCMDDNSVPPPHTHTHTPTTTITCTPHLSCADVAMVPGRAP